MALLRGFVEKLGMYPQTVVPLGELHDILTNNYAAQTYGVTATGASYTANKDGSMWNPATGNQELNLEYAYLGDRYVKVTPYATGTNANHSYNNNGGAIGQIPSTNTTSYRWFKVEPIKWIILNINTFDKRTEENGIVTNLGSVSAPLELYAADVLMSGIAFNSGGNTLWTNSDIKTYLNGDFYNQAFLITDKEQIQESTIYNSTTAGENNNTTGLNSNHLQSGGQNSTDQRVYLLSYYELGDAASPYGTNGSKIFASGDGASSTRQVSGTDYARAHYLYISSSPGKVEYWTRSALSSNSVYYVLYNGSIGSASTNHASIGTRPALTMVCFAL